MYWPQGDVLALSSITVVKQLSRKKKLHSITVFFDRPSSCIISSTVKPCNHKYTSSVMSSNFTFESTSHDSCLIVNFTSFTLYFRSPLTTECCFLHPHVCPSLESLIFFKTMYWPQGDVLAPNTEGPGHSIDDLSTTCVHKNLIVECLNEVT